METQVKSVAHSSNLTLEQYTCEWIEEMIDYYLPSGQRIDELGKKHLLVSSSIPSTYEVAEAVVKIYNSIYKGTYPYHEMLDVENVYHTFSNPKYYWRVFQIEQTGQIIGCCTIVVDLYNRRAYCRGLNILPEFQGQVGVRELSSGMMRAFLVHYHDQIDKWFIEARTAHTAVQYIANMAGAKPHALLFNKDQFFHKYETDCFQVAYRYSAMHSQRIPPLTLPLQIAPLYEYICHLHDLSLNEITFYFPKPKCKDQKKKHLSTSLILNETELEYGYRQIRLEDTYTGSYWQAEFIPEIQTLEHISYQFTDENLISIFVTEINCMICQENRYIEWQVPVSDTKLVEAMLSNEKFRVIGYLPAWRRVNQNSSFFEDVVVFAHLRGSLANKSMKLIPSAKQLCNFLEIY